MFSLIHKPSRLGLLAITLMLVGAANLFTLSVDTDDDDDTPPITVELNFIAPARKSAHVHQTEPVRHLKVSDARLGSPKAGLSTIRHISLSHLPKPDSPQFVIPLRT